MKDEVYLWKNGKHPIPSLKPYLAYSLAKSEARMDTKLMKKDDIGDCRWIGNGICKGVTSPERAVSIVGIPKSVTAGLHGEMIQGFALVDPAPLCYNAAHARGFGNFVRWVFFSEPSGQAGFFGVDFSLALRKTSGVATSFARVDEVVKTAARHGIPRECTVALLNWRMCEPTYIEAVRWILGIHTVRDWLQKGTDRFGENGSFCPRCGQRTFKNMAHRYCNKCGALRSTHAI